MSHKLEHCFTDSATMPGTLICVYLDRPGSLSVVEQLVEVRISHLCSERALVDHTLSLREDVST